MLISKTAKVRWNPKIYKHYIDLGYQYTKMGDEFEVKVEDLTRGSMVLVTYECDYCHQQKQSKWQYYIVQKERSVIHKDCCEDCLEIKAKESIMLKYGTYNFQSIPEIKAKMVQTNMEKYGCENPFANEEIKQKIRQTCLKKYGVEYSGQIPEVQEKIKQTTLERYGVVNYGAIWSKEHKGELSPTWKGENVIHERLIREQSEYREWRKSVFDRDLYTCQCCGARNGNGKYIRLEAHHIYNYGKYPEKVFDIENGITFCQQCHINFHSTYGKKDNTPEQLKEFLKIKDKKIC